MWIGFLVRQSQSLGLSKDEAEIITHTHFWFSLALLVVFGLLLVVRAIRQGFRD